MEDKPLLIWCRKTCLRAASCPPKGLSEVGKYKDPGCTQAGHFEVRSGNWPVLHATRPQWAGHWAIRCQETPSRPLGWSEPTQSVLGGAPHTPSLHERRQPGALSWVQPGVLWAPMPRQTGGTWPQGTPGAGGLRRGAGGAALCLTSADIDPRAPISSPMGGARGLA